MCRHVTLSSGLQVQRSVPRIASLLGNHDVRHLRSKLKFVEVLDVGEEQRRHHAHFLSEMRLFRNVTLQTKDEEPPLFDLSPQARLRTNLIPSRVLVTRPSHTAL